MDNYNSNDIICALSTPPGKGALAIVRISGTGAIELTSKAVPSLATLTQSDARKLYHDFIYDPDGNPIDEITFIPYYSPKSYTAEEMVEIICHGGFAASHAIVVRLLELGIRPAEPGEFTRRAFLNGRISLSEAEAVAAAIEAKSELALKAAARNLKGELYDKIAEIKGAIIDLLTLLEAEIDFSEEEIDKTSFDKIRAVIDQQLQKSEIILNSYDFGRGLNSGYKLAIVGRANVGKSSLLNALLRRDRAIVTDIPGTTRDTLTEWIEIEGFPILLTDTAGLRQAENPVEAIGQERTKDEIEKADLVLFMVDCVTGVGWEDAEIYYSIQNKRSLLIANKIDLCQARPEVIEKGFADIPRLFISTLTGEGLDDLRKQIASMLHLDTFSLDTAILATERQQQAMKKALDSLTHAKAKLASAPQGEIIAVYLREALDYLGELVGETTAEDILNNIFGRFCIGK